MNALQPAVAKSFLRQLSGFRGYPKDDEAQTRFIEVLCEVSLSVEHALAIIWAFEDQFPTLKEIRDTAFNLRPKFEAKVDQTKQWEKQYGKPKPEWSVRFQEKAAGAVLSVDPKERKRLHAEEKRAMLWQAVRDAIFYTDTSMGRAELAAIDDKDERINAFKFWRQAAQRNQRDYPAEVAAFRQQLETTGWDELMVYDWANGSFPPVARQSVGAVDVPKNPITAEDVKRELRAQGRDSGDGE
jgi:hypothetical protein